MGKLKITWTLFAKIQLRKIYEYYKDKASFNVAQKIKNDLLLYPEILEIHADIGQEEETLKSLQEGYRYLIKSNYKIIWYNSKK